MTLQLCSCTSEKLLVAPFDSHSVTISSDAMGTLVFAGEGGASAASSIDTTAAGDIWDNFDGVKGHSGADGWCCSY